MKKSFIKTLIPIITILYFSLTIKTTYALDCDTYYQSQSPGGTGGVVAPGPTQFLCPLLKVVNFAFLIGGIVFAIMIGYGAIKMSTALGDPKGLEGARRTWLFALIGVFVVLGSLAIVRIISAMFGFNIPWLGGTEDIFDQMESRFEHFFIDELGLYSYQ